MESIKELSEMRFKEFWALTNKFQREQIKGAYNRYPWHPLFTARFTTYHEINAMRAAGLYVHILGVTYDGEWAVDLGGFDNLPDNLSELMVLW